MTDMSFPLWYFLAVCRYLKNEDNKNECSSKLNIFLNFYFLLLGFFVVVLFCLALLL